MATKIPKPKLTKLIRDYQVGDVYYELAKLCGLTNEPDIKK